MIDVVMIRLGVRHPTERPESLGVWMLVLMVLWMRTKSLESAQPYAGLIAKQQSDNLLLLHYTIYEAFKQTWYLRALTNNLLDRARQREALRR